MHRVELKVYVAYRDKDKRDLFLMHRVELKDALSFFFKSYIGIVPNAPCGVERTLIHNNINPFPLVPNAPCGVESIIPDEMINSFGFVPNAPCGVERLFILIFMRLIFRFLMHRVELKDAHSQNY